MKTTTTKSNTGMAKGKKGWHEMNTRELAEATSQFDSPGYRPRRVKASVKELEKLRRAKEKPKSRPGRKPFGTGAVRVLFTIDPELFARLDAFARQMGLNRSQLISVSVESYMKRNSPEGSKATAA
jgi:hypothetical protein